ncbi:MAG: ACT domain-containing protein [Candidatus Limnocylindria bacterium]
MNAFVVELDNRPGELARLAELCADKGINIIAISAAATGSSGAIGIATNDEAGTRSALDAASISYREIELVSAGLEDRPGTLAQATRRLADAGVNIELVMATGRSGSRVDVAFGVDDATKAREALGEMVTTGSTA